MGTPRSACHSLLHPSAYWASHSVRPRADFCDFELIVSDNASATHGIYAPLRSARRPFPRAQHRLRQEHFFAFQAKALFRILAQRLWAPSMLSQSSPPCAPIPPGSRLLPTSTPPRRRPLAKPTILKTTSSRLQGRAPAPRLFEAQPLCNPTP
jgi:hypothetical protein